MKARKKTWISPYSVAVLGLLSFPMTVGAICLRATQNPVSVGRFEITYDHSQWEWNKGVMISCGPETCNSRQYWMAGSITVWEK